MFAKIFPIILWFQLLLLPDYIADVRCFIDYLIQFPGGVDQLGEKSCIFQNVLNRISNFNSSSPVWSPNTLILESFRIGTTISWGYKSPCIFIEVVLLFVLIFSWDSRFSKYGTFHKSVVIIKEKITRKKMFSFLLR
jgi:hypothetical protein